MTEYLGNKLQPCYIGIVTFDKCCVYDMELLWLLSIVGFHVFTVKLIICVMFVLFEVGCLLVWIVQASIADSKGNVYRCIWCHRWYYISDYSLKISYCLKSFANRYDLINSNTFWYWIMFLFETNFTKTGLILRPVFSHALICNSSPAHVSNWDQWSP